MGRYDAIKKLPGYWKPNGWIRLVDVTVMNAWVFTVGIVCWLMGWGDVAGGWLVVGLVFGGWLFWLPLVFAIWAKHNHTLLVLYTQQQGQEG